MPAAGCELVHFEASDGVTLPALHYRPRRPSGDAVIYLHGNGDSSVFYSARTNLLAEPLVARGVGFLPFNNRGAHLLKRLHQTRGGKRRSIDGGMAYERIRDAVFDIEGAIELARRAGYRRIHLAGHSTGANKIAVFNMRRPKNPVRSYVLLAGGDDSGLYRAQWGDRKFDERVAKLRAMIAEGKGHVFVPRSWSPFLISAASLYDTVNPDGDYNVFPFREVMTGHRVSRRPLFRHYRTITRPTLALYGSEDEYCFGDVPQCVEILGRYAPPRHRTTFEIMAGANHGFNGFESELGARLAEWVRKGS